MLRDFAAEDGISYTSSPPSFHLSEYTVALYRLPEPLITLDSNNFLTYNVSPSPHPNPSPSNPTHLIPRHRHRHPQLTYPKPSYNPKHHPPLPTPTPRPHRPLLRRMRPRDGPPTTRPHSLPLPRRHSHHLLQADPEPARAARAQYMDMGGASRVFVGVLPTRKFRRGASQHGGVREGYLRADSCTVRVQESV